MVNGLHLFKSLHFHSKDDEQNKYAHVPSYTPTILQQPQGHHHHHRHIYHLQRAASNDASNDDEDGNYSSLFIPENGTEKRGIFRTVEPIWVCPVDVAPNHSQEANQDGLIVLDNDSQKVLEKAFKKKDLMCTLSVDSTTGHCNVDFHYDDAPSSLNTYVKDTTATTITNKNNNATATSYPQTRHLSYGTDIQRMTTPVWWYEQVGITGKKELKRFDWKNQIRLEAFDGDESTLSLTDKAFKEPFTVALNPYSERKHNEWQGFIYLDTVPRLDEVEVVDENEEDYHDLTIQGKDNFPNFNVYAVEGKEEAEEEAYRKAHIKRK